MPQNKEYIEREEALRQIFLEAMGHNFDFNAEYREIYLSAKRAIKNIPAADVAEVRHGRWIDKGWYGDSSWQIDGRGNCWRVHECSECNVEKKGETTKYCPHCGAKMDKEEYND